MNDFFREDSGVISLPYAICLWIMCVYVIVFISLLHFSIEGLSYCSLSLCYIFCPAGPLDLCPSFCPLLEFSREAFHSNVLISCVVYLVATKLLLWFTMSLSDAGHSAHHAPVPSKCEGGATALPV